MDDLSSVLNSGKNRSLHLGANRKFLSFPLSTGLPDCERLNTPRRVARKQKGLRMLSSLSATLLKHLK